MGNDIHIGKINRVAVFDELQNLSEQYLTEVHEEYIDMFVNEAKRIADNALDDFIFSQEEVYTADSLRRIKDQTVLMAFTDVQTGYRSQMRRWVESNPIEVKKQTISMDYMPEDIPMPEREAFKRAMIAFGIGTLVVIGLRIIIGSKWIWLAELATLAVSGTMYFSGKGKDDPNCKSAQEVWMKSQKLRIISNIKQDLDAWFDVAEQENDRILKTFNIE